MPDTGPTKPSDQARFNFPWTASMKTAVSLGLTAVFKTAHHGEPQLLAWTRQLANESLPLQGNEQRFEQPNLIRDAADC